MLTRQVVDAQQSDDESIYFRTRLVKGQVLYSWSFGDDQGLRFQGHAFVPLASRELVMIKFHHSRSAVHLGGIKMYHDLCRQY